MIVRAGVNEAKRDHLHQPCLELAGRGANLSQMAQAMLQLSTMTLPHAAAQLCNIGWLHVCSS